MAPKPNAAASSTPVDQLAATASQWVARREAGLSAAERSALQAWLKADPRHAAALAAADCNASPLDWPVHSGAVDRVLQGLAARAKLRRERTSRLVRTSTVAVLICLGAYFVRPQTPLPADHGNSLVVRGPEQQRLPDGSIVERKGDADFRVAFTADTRRIELVRGTVHFTVLPDARRPFLVSAGGVTARAVGTAFLVGFEEGQVALVVTEGQVALDHETPAAASTTLAFVQAGESIAVDQTDATATTAPRVTTLPIAEQAQRLDWRTPRLEFNGTPLREVIAIVNRHTTTPLVLGDPALGELKLSGAMRADRVDALLEMVEADFLLTTEQSGSALVLRKRGR